MTRNVGLDVRVAGHVDELARWWTSAPEEARYALLKAVIEGTTKVKGGLPSLRLAIILAEIEAGEVAEG